ncbi:MAG: YqhA family protein [Pseudomonadota bacterium]|nr:YqhA family protein [Pseudomonadota bacterium]
MRLKLLERTVESSKYLSVITILLILLAALALCIGVAMSFVTVILDAVREGPWEPKVAKEAAIGFLSMIDLLLIAIGLQTIAVGIYRIFLNADLRIPSALPVSSFSDLKAAVVKMIGIVLSILFLESAFKLGPGEPILYFGLAIAVVIAASAWAIGQEKKQEHRSD